MKKLAILCVFLTVGASATVKDSAPNGFTVTQSYDVAGSPADAYKKFLAVGEWWESTHTFSQNAHNLTIEEKPQGCWCEKLPGGGPIAGGVRHMELVYFMPGKTLRFTGGLGPLQSFAGAGAMTITFTAKEGGTHVDMSYAVFAYSPTGMAALAPVVDSVLAIQFGRFKNLLDTGKPDAAK